MVRQHSRDTVPKTSIKNETSKPQPSFVASSKNGTMTYPRLGPLWASNQPRQTWWLPTPASPCTPAIFRGGRGGRKTDGISLRSSPWHAVQEMHGHPPLGPTAADDSVAADVGRSDWHGWLLKDLQSNGPHSWQC